MMLKDYLSSKQMTITDFAKKSGFSREFISLLIANKRKIRERNAKIISMFTEGEVSVKELLHHNDVYKGK
jgi:plasmid maintenance system antidote protein VapI